MATASQRYYERNLTRKNKLGQSNYPTIQKSTKKVINRNYLNNTKQIINHNYRKIKNAKPVSEVH